MTNTVRRSRNVQASLDRRLAEWADYNAKVDAAQGDWTQGASRALDNFLAQGGNGGRHDGERFHKRI